MATKEVNLQHVDDLIFISDVHFGARAASDEWMDNFVDYYFSHRFSACYWWRGLSQKQT